MGTKEASVYFGDYHTHTHYSDGVSTVRQNIDAAIALGLKELAFTDHGFNNPRYGGLSRDSFIKQRAEITEYGAGKSLRVYHGVEADLISLGGDIDLNEDEMRSMEVLIVGYHSFAEASSFYDWRKMYLPSFFSFLVKPSRSVVERNTKAFINAIKRHPIDIAAHINHLFKVDCYELSKACADYGTYVELNAKHLSAPDDLEKILKSGAKLIASSDAHRFDSIGGFAKIEEALSAHGADPEILANRNKKPEFPRREKRIKE